jgi:hypothetical protein
VQEISGRLHSIELNVIAQDYQVIMQILEKNMTEGQNEFKKPRKPRSSANQRQEPSKGMKTIFSFFLVFSASSLFNEKTLSGEEKIYLSCD